MSLAVIKIISMQSVNFLGDRRTPSTPKTGLNIENAKQQRKQQAKGTTRKRRLPKEKGQEPEKGKAQRIIQKEMQAKARTRAKANAKAKTLQRPQSIQRPRDEHQLGRKPHSLEMPMVWTVGQMCNSYI